jgi:hypothetical protein
MELKTQALDRLLEALSPALAAELDRVAAETREALEQEFQKQLQSAVRDAENEVRTAAEAQLNRAAADAEAQLNRAVEDARQATRKQVTEQLEAEFKKRLAETTAQLKSEAAAEREPLQQQLEQWRTFAEIQHQLAEASSQSEILSRFLRLARPFAAGLGVYVTKADGLALW